MQRFNCNANQGCQPILLYSKVCMLFNCSQFQPCFKSFAKNHRPTYKGYSQLLSPISQENQPAPRISEFYRHTTAQNSTILRYKMPLSSRWRGENSRAMVCINLVLPRLVLARPNSSLRRNCCGVGMHFQQVLLHIARFHSLHYKQTEHIISK